MKSHRHKGALPAAKRVGPLRKPRMLRAIHGQPLPTDCSRNRDNLGFDQHSQSSPFVRFSPCRCQHGHACFCPAVDGCSLNCSDQGAQKQCMHAVHAVSPGSLTQLIDLQARRRQASQDGGTRPRKKPICEAKAGEGPPPDGLAALQAGAVTQASAPTRPTSLLDLTGPPPGSVAGQANPDICGVCRPLQAPPALPQPSGSAAPPGACGAEEDTQRS